MKNELCERLGIEYPIFAFSHCRDVVAAVSRAGGLGVMGAVAFSPSELEVELKWIDEHVDGKPYGIDTVIPAQYVGKSEGDLAKDNLEKLIPEGHKKWVDNLLQKYGVPELPEGMQETEGLLGWSISGGRAHVEVSLKHPICLIANALGSPPEDVIKTAHSKGLVVAALCGTVQQAMRHKDAGVDIIVAQGYEAGGHTGEIATMVLVPQVVDAVGKTPVLAAGGIGNGRQMAAAMMLGAQGVWTGSVWLTTRESDCVPALVDKMLVATSKDTVRSKCISGKPARQLVTTYTKAWEAEDCPGTLPMPLQFMLTGKATQRIHKYAQTGKPGSAELVGTPVGQIVGQMNQVLSVKQVVQGMVEEYVDVVSRVSEQLHRAAAE